MPAERFDQYAHDRSGLQSRRTPLFLFFIGLRLSAGIRPAAEEWLRFDAPIHRFLDAGLLETDGATLRLTSRGVLLSNEVFQEFLNL